MIDVFIWLGIGLLSGWIGQLATRTEEENSPATYLIAGIVGGVIGGILGRVLDASDTTYYLVNTESIMGAALLAPLAVFIYGLSRSFLGGASQSQR